MTRLARLGLLGLLAAGVAGCGSTNTAGTSGVAVKGTVHKGKKPLAGGGSVVLFDSASPNRHLGTINAADGKVEFEKVKPGTYKFCVYQPGGGGGIAKGATKPGSKAGPAGGPPKEMMGQGGDPGDAMFVAMDKLKGQYGRDKTQMTLTVGGSEVDFGIIDLDDESTWKK